MSEPALELQRGIFQALIASETLKAAMGGTVRAYDRVPAGTPAAPLVFPYISFSEAQALDNGNACEADMFEIFVDLHVWSRSVGMAEAKTISGVVRAAMLAIDIVADWKVPIVEFQQARHMNDPDGLTTHSVNTFRFLLEPTGD
jgi:hypothetical protein